VRKKFYNLVYFATILLLTSCANYPNIGTFYDNIYYPCSINVTLNNEKLKVVEDGVEINLIKLKNLLARYFKGSKIPNKHDESINNYTVSIDYLHEASDDKYSLSNKLVVTIEKTMNNNHPVVIAKLYPGPLLKNVEKHGDFENTYQYREYLRSQPKFQANIFGTKKKYKKIDRIEEIASIVFSVVLENIQISK